MRAIIIVVGDEVLSGNTLDTNSRFLAQELSLFGIEIVKIITISDDEDQLREVFSKSLESVDYIFTTGGLGPTNDDMTKEIISKTLGQKLVERPEALENVKKHLKGREELLEVNLKQAYFPESAEIIVNDLGTAPGGILKKDEKRVFLLPGPSEQLEHIFEKMKDFLPKEEDFSRKILKSEGMVEAAIYEKLEDLMHVENPTVRIYVSKSGRRLELLAKDTEEKSSLDLIEDLEEEIRQRMGEFIYGEEDDTMESVLFRLLEKYNLTIATGESFTGGEIASRLISVPGMSDHLSESFVTYSEQAKERILGVSREQIEKYGVVSVEVAEEMLAGLERNFENDLNISTTGFAGPGENAGLSYIGISFKGMRKIYKKNFSGSRNIIRRRGSQFALFMAWKMIKDYY